MRSSALGTDKQKFCRIRWRCWKRSPSAQGSAEIGSVEVQGHTDNTVQPAPQSGLEQDRAQAVTEALIRLGVDRRLIAKGYGQEKPILPNTSEPNRARNRRVQ